ncbi:MAG: lpdA, partial [Bacillota bacterium]|nr:lpdA [Bacillota bacterium]
MENKLVIIGGGPGGYEAAIRASQLGANVTLIEENKLGGTCLNKGCIPTKALYKNAEVINTLQNISEFGIELSNYSVDMIKVQERKNEVVNKLRSGIEQLLKGNKIEVINGKATFIGDKTLEVKTENSVEKLTAENIIIATGSNSSVINVPGIDLNGVITSDEALNFNYIPKSMVIVGGGVIGIEFASIFATMGTDVTIIEFLPRLMYRMDEELSKRITMYLKKKKIKIVTGIGVKEIISSESGLKVVAGNDKGDTEYECENVLVAAGRVPNVTGLNLEAENIEYDRKGIRVNENYETSQKGIYA